MNDRLTPEREAEIVAAVTVYEGHPNIGFACCSAHGPADGTRELLAELAAVRAERAQAQARILQLETEQTTLLGVISDAAEQARDDHDRITELERPAVEAKRNEIRDSYAELINQCTQDRDHEGAFEVQCQLADREAQWRREDEAAS